MLEVLSKRKCCEDHDIISALARTIPAAIWFSLLLMSCAPHAHADSTAFTGFRGHAADWVGNCVAELEIGTPSNEVANASLAVICNNVVNVEEFLVGNLNSRSGHYSANVTSIKNLTGMEYDQDVQLDLRRSENGCAMSGTVTDANGSNDISFQSDAPGC